MNKLFKKCKNLQLNIIKGFDFISNNSKKDDTDIFLDNKFNDTQYIETNNYSCNVNIIDDIYNKIIHSQDFYETYKMLKIIYRKKYKAAFIVKSKINKQNYFIKIKSNEIDDNNEYSIYEKLKDVNSKYIIKYIDYIKKIDYSYYIYEYYLAENLFEYVKKNNVNIIKVKHIFYQIATAVKLLHDNNIIHGDLKLENILINENLDIKIIDFDLSNVFSGEYVSDSIYGTVNYIAPESYNLAVYSKKSDVWCMGVILYVLLTKKFPCEMNLISCESKSNMFRINNFRHINYQIILDNFDQNTQQLLQGLLFFEDDKRMNIDQVLSYKW